jgi:hypothetical protein
VTINFSKKFDDFCHRECYKTPEKCPRTTQLRKLNPDGTVNLNMPSIVIDIEDVVLDERSHNPANIREERPDVN